MTPDLVRQLSADVELPLRNAGTSLAMFYGLGDWAHLPEPSRLDAGRRALNELRAAASALSLLRQRLASDLVAAEDAMLAADEGVCCAEWGACPEHGATLRSSGGKSWCTSPLCGRSWPHDRLRRHCTEPAAIVAGDRTDGRMRLCAGHWLDAQDRLPGIRLIRWLPQPSSPNDKSTVDGGA